MTRGGRGVISKGVKRRKLLIVAVTEGLVRGLGGEGPQVVLCSFVHGRSFVPNQLEHAYCPPPPINLKVRRRVGFMVRRLKFSPPTNRSSFCGLVFSFVNGKTELEGKELLGTKQRHVDWGERGELLEGAICHQGRFGGKGRRASRRTIRYQI